MFICAIVKVEKLEQKINKCLHKIHDICHKNIYLYFLFNKFLVTEKLELHIPYKFYTHVDTHTHTHTHTHTQTLTHTGKHRHTHTHIYEGLFGDFLLMNIWAATYHYFSSWSENMVYAYMSITPLNWQYRSTQIIVQMAEQILIGFIEGCSFHRWNLLFKSRNSVLSGKLKTDYGTLAIITLSQDQSFKFSSIL